MQKLSEIFTAAAGIIERNGLNQDGHYVKGGGFDDCGYPLPREAIADMAMCFMGAINYAAPSASRVRHYGVIAKLFPTKSVCVWNDNPTTTKEDVIAKLLEGAEIARADENV